MYRQTGDSIKQNDKHYSTVVKIPGLNINKNNSNINGSRQYKAVSTHGTPSFVSPQPAIATM